MSRAKLVSWECLWSEESGLPMIFMYSTLLMNRVMFGYHLPDAKPVEEIGAIAPRPMLLIHCQTDKDIPVSHMASLRQPPYSFLYRLTRSKSSISSVRITTGGSGTL